MNPFLRHLSTALVIAFCLLAISGMTQQTNRPNSRNDAVSVDEKSRRETMAKLETIPECRDYLGKYNTAISAKCSNFDTKSSPHDTMIQVRFILHQDGSVSDIVISGDTSAPVAPMCIKAIKDCSPFPKWPDKMRSIVGKDYLEIHYHFGFNMTPPGPE
jgi:hypothetical protein